MTSIRLKLPLTAALLFAAGLGILMVSGAIFLEPFYAARTRHDFRCIQERLSTFGADDRGLADEIKSMGAGSGYKIVIADGNGMVLASSVPEYRERQSFPLPREQLAYLIGHREQLDKSEPFFGILEGDAGGQSVIQLVARLGVRRYLVVTQPLEYLRKNVTTASHFFLLVGGFVLLLEFTIVLVLSGTVARPILGLAEVARRVAAQDFSAHFDHRRNDELGLLGDSINIMAASLARNIGELTVVNTELAVRIRMRDDFLAGAAHELKTPIGLVRGYAEAIKLGLYATEQERDELADIILKESDHLDRLVRDLAEIAELDDMANSSNSAHAVTKSTLVLENADLSRTVSNAVTRFAMKARDKGVGLRLAGPSALQARFDNDRMVQVVDNLLSNALRHVSRGGAIDVRLSGSLRLEVENSGDQVPEELLSSLFEPFYRVDSSRSRGSGGSGLGLAIVRSIMQAHGGSSGAHNVPGGFMVWVQLPRMS